MAAVQNALNQIVLGEDFQRAHKILNPSFSESDKTLMILTKATIYPHHFSYVGQGYVGSQNQTVSRFSGTSGLGAHQRLLYTYLTLLLLLVAAELS